jgi:hypothetical protein
MECIIPVASAVVINDAWNASYKEHRPWLLTGDKYTVPVASSVVINDAWNASYKGHHRTEQH